METIIFLLILGASLFNIAQPYFQKQLAVSKPQKSRNHQLTDLQARRDTVLASIKDLEFDHEMGKISDEYYAQMNAQFRREAVAIFQQIDQSNSKPSARKALEAKLRSSRKNRKPKAASFCRRCGTALTQGDRFCNQCGEKVG